MRRTAFYLVAGAAFALSACSQPASPTGAAKQPVAAKAETSTAETPAFWSIETRDNQDKVTKTVLICADSAVRRGFMRPMPSPNGKPCQYVAPPVEKAERFSARCKTGADLFDIQSERTGDPDREFEVKLLIRSNIQGSENLAQTLHYRRLGACPSGWESGDAGTPGDRKVTNAVSGTTRELASPIRPPAS